MPVLEKGPHLGYNPSQMQKRLRSCFSNSNSSHRLHLSPRSPTSFTSENSRSNVDNEFRTQNYVLNHFLNRNPLRRYRKKQDQDQILVPIMVPRGPKNPKKQVREAIEDPSGSQSHPKKPPEDLRSRPGDRRGTSGSFENHNFP